MQYFGGKALIAPELSKKINSLLKPDQAFVDMFCGSCNVILKIDPNRQRFANDVNHYLIAMWVALQDGWTPPSEITENSLIYCDIPYKNTTGYAIGEFNHVEFYKWAEYMKKQGHMILVSEYEKNIPPYKRVIWRKKSTSTAHIGKGIDTVEVLVMI